MAEIQENVDLVNIIPISLLPPSPGTLLSWLGVVANPDTGRAYRDTWLNIAAVIANQIGSVTTIGERFYHVGGGGEFDPSDGASSVSDPNLDQVDYDLMKWGIGDLQKGADWQNDVDGGGWSLLSGTMTNGETYVARPRPKVSNILAAPDAIGRFSAGVKIVTVSGLQLSADFRKVIILSSATSTMTYTIKAANVYPANVLLRIETGLGVQKQSTINIEGGASFMWGGDTLTELYLGQQHFVDLVSDGAQWYVAAKSPERNFSIQYGWGPGINELAADGQEYSQADYPGTFARLTKLKQDHPTYVKTLSEWANNQGCWGLGATSFKVPSFPGRSIRTLDPSGTIDEDRYTAGTSSLPGSYQEDGIKAHIHSGGEADNSAHGSGSSAQTGPTRLLVNNDSQGRNAHASIPGFKTGSNDNATADTRGKNVGYFASITII